MSKIDLSPEALQQEREFALDHFLPFYVIGIDKACAMIDEIERLRKENAKLEKRLSIFEMKNKQASGWRAPEKQYGEKNEY